MAEHTEGPWTYEDHQLSEGYSGIVYDQHGMRIADHLSHSRSRLIAAAPLLLEALKTFTDEYVALVNSGDCGFWDPEKEKKVIAARATLTAAKPEE